MRGLAAAAAAAVLALAAAPAHAAFPWPGAGTAGDPASYHVDRGQDPRTGTASELSCADWKGAATPAPPSRQCKALGGNVVTDAQDALVRADPRELGGIRGDATTDVLATDPITGAPVRTAWNVTTGRPDVLIAVLDSGIEWDDRAAMNDLRRKVHLNAGELPVPRHDRRTALDTDPDGSRIDCARYRHRHDANRDGVLNVDDYACDRRVHASAGGVKDLLDPEDVIIAFTNRTDADHDGFADDIAGWDFVDDDNDAYDDVHYGHGTGEARDSTAEADNGGSVGTCPNCMVLPLRVGESFVADVNRFALATLYATDLGASIVQEALGTLDDTTLARDAIDYAYRHGVAVIASAADEAAQHHNLPGVLPHTILVNSVTRYDATFTPQPRSHLQLNGCTNFMSRLTVSVPSSSCSSEATGRMAGVVGLIESAALDARARGTLGDAPGCRRIGGRPCPVTPDEVRQLVQGTADDVDFAAQDVRCPGAPPLPGLCTDPNANAPTTRLDISPLPDTVPYPARHGFDEFYGYGRLDARAAVERAAAGDLPPTVSIESPAWYAQADPHAATVDVRGVVDGSRSAGGWTCTVLAAPGVDPSNGSDASSAAYADTADPGDFRPAPGGFCDGTTVHRGATSADQLLGSVDMTTLKGLFPEQTRQTAFAGNEHGGSPAFRTRPGSEPYSFTIKVVATTAGDGGARRGEDRRQLFLHRDADLLGAFPFRMTSDGDSSPLLVDLDGDNRNDLVFATSDGEVHALDRNAHELPGFPVHGDPPPALHRRERAFRRHEVPRPPGSAILASLAAGDLDGDGAPELVGADLDGRVYVWSARGKRLRTMRGNPNYSGRPLKPFVNVRHGARDRVEAGFLASPVLADLDGNHRLDIVAASEDRHVYAWDARGRPLPGFPVLVADPSQVTKVDPVTHHLTFRTGLGALDQGKLVDTPGVGDLDGDGRPEIVIGSNEEYPAAQDGGTNASVLNTALVAVIGATGLLHQGNGRVYAIRPTGDPDAPDAGRSPFLPGWPRKVGLLDTELLPDVGEGINGSPVLARLRCPHGGTSMKVGVTPAAGVGYLLNPDGSSCYGSLGGKDVALQTDIGEGQGQLDHPVFPAVGLPAFGDLHGNGRLSFLAPVAGLLRAVDLLAPDQQTLSQDFTGAWDPATGQFEPGFPAVQNDLSFLTGPAVADIDGVRGEEVVAGTASMDLQAFSADGGAASDRWPKLTGDWTVSTPAIGSLGTLDTDPAARKVVVAMTRSGDVSAYATGAPACSPGSWPRFHHDLANSGDATRDAVAPGRPAGAAVDGDRITFTAPGDDLLCGRAARYEVLRSAHRITGRERGWARVAGAAPAAAGAPDAVALPGGRGAYVAVRAVDDAGNRSRPAVVRARR